MPNWELANAANWEPMNAQPLKSEPPERGCQGNGWYSLYCPATAQNFAVLYENDVIVPKRHVLCLRSLPYSRFPSFGLGFPARHSGCCCFERAPAILRIPTCSAPWTQFAVYNACPKYSRRACEVLRGKKHSKVYTVIYIPSEPINPAGAEVRSYSQVRQRKTV